MLAQLVHLAPYISFLRFFLETVCWTSSSASNTSSATPGLYTQSGWNYDAWLLLIMWWTVCIFFGTCARFVVPVGGALWWWRRSKHSSHSHSHTHGHSQQLMTEKNVESILSDLSIIQSLTAPTPSPSSSTTTPPFSPFSDEFQSRPLQPITQLRIFLGIYVFYLSLTIILPLRLVIALGGTLVLTWKAPWAVKARSILWRNAFVRWGIYRAFSRISGIPLKDWKTEKKKEIQSSGAKAAQVNAPGDAPVTPAPGMVGATKTETTHRFLFQIQENQRWWMGLDWTSALLPGERPSWSTIRSNKVSFGSLEGLSQHTDNSTPSSSRSPTRAETTSKSRSPERARQPTLDSDRDHKREGSASFPGSIGPYHPVTPPTQFSLPPPSTIVLHDHKTGKRIRRTARWSWEESEWKVVVRSGVGDSTSGGTTSTNNYDDSGEVRVERVEKPLSVMNDDNGSMFTKAAQKAASRIQEREREKEREAHAATGEGEKNDTTNEEAEDDDTYTLTDADGWVYADNKWENKASRPGIGKYTRYRRWTRIAVIKEIVEILEDDGSHSSLPSSSFSSSATTAESSTVALANLHPTGPNNDIMPVEKEIDKQKEQVPPVSPTSREPLRRRINSVLGIPG